MTKPTDACPRCGKAAIEVKDWGKAGALYVHSRTVENGIPVQDACGVAAVAPRTDEVEALAQEIAASEGMSIGRALEVAREQLSGLLAYAEAWETWVAAWHDPRIANVRASLERARGSRPYAGRAWHIRAAEQQLAELEAQHAAGTLGPIVDDGSPF